MGAAAVNWLIPSPATVPDTAWPIGRLNQDAAEGQESNRTCSKCGEVKGEDQFYRVADSAMRKGWTHLSRCKQCISADRKAARERKRG